ncbi:MAG: ribonuclease E/G [Rhodospirillales bacterium]|nr:ribonuclease E/G [Rhodospirillales bacterium]
MATKSMLIDASHPEETRVVVIDGTRLEGYDVEVASRRQLKGNIYLAKVTRVEPSLQAAFVDYGGNRHGFLAFNEIHPDYYQIPVADRQALMQEQVQAEAHEDEDEDDEDDAGPDAEGDTDAAAAEEDAGEPVEVIGGDDEEELERRPPRPVTRHYKIQEVIKRRQILLVQVVKEERGNKGAALTTYLSLAGRYCVLMPNTSRGGGISRKISGLTDRKRLKKILAELEVPDGMGVIVRTAGSGRTKAEIKRDYEYLMRLWGNIRETTLSSIAPALVYEEANLIKRSIRDLYGRDTEEIVIQGEPEYRTAKEFMKLFIPSHAKRVKLHDDSERPLFNLYKVESQLDAMHLPSVPLKSGGYIVINPTEALVSIDVNSGRATRERHIEETALRTNVEAADEIARQLRLRDLAGLIVIDFIDMENSRNQGQVERRIKEALKTDRARIQVGRISPFGLMELSRQRLRPSLLETSFEPCPYCGGMGVCRTTESTVLSILRKIEEEGLKAKGGSVTVTAAPTVAMYLLNQKRTTLARMEARFQLRVIIAADNAYAPAEHRLERIKGAVVVVETAGAPMAEPAAEAAEPAAEAAADEEEAAAEAEAEGAAAPAAGEESKRSRRRRPRRRRRSDDETRAQPPAEAEETGEHREPAAVAGAEAEAEAEADAEPLAAETDGDGEGQAESSAQAEARKRRRRGKRGGRRRPRRGDQEETLPAGAAEDGAELPAADEAEGVVAIASASGEEAGGEGAEEAYGYEPDADHEPSEEARPAEDAAFLPDEPQPPVIEEVGGEQAFEPLVADEREPVEAEAEAGGEAEHEAEHAAEHAAGPEAEPSAPQGAEAEVEERAEAETREERPAESFEIVSYSADGVGSWEQREDHPAEPSPGEEAASHDDAPEQGDAAPAQAPSGDGNGSGNGREAAEPEHEEGDENAADVQAAARTEVIHVGGGDGAQPGAPRRGWWQRLMS